MAGYLAIRRAARMLRSGGVVAHPTEAVYGLACDPLNPVAVGRVLALKGRSVEKGLILVAASFDQLARFVTIPGAEELARAEAEWPGPVTWLFPAAADTPYWLTGRYSSLAVRVTAHPLTRALCDAFGGPLVSTSANPAGRPPPRSSLAVRRYFGETLDRILCGPLGGSDRPSEIRDLLSGRVLRAG